MKVLLIHGLGRTSLSLLGMEWRLKQAGLTTEQFNYSAFLASYCQIVARLQSRLEKIASQGAYGIVAHSLGGLLARSALGWDKIPRPKRVVMLGTPNRSPRLARLAWQLAPFRWFAGDCGQNLAQPSFFSQLPSFKAPYTIIAGTAGPRAAWSPFGFEVNDGIVALSETPISNADRPLTLPVNHTWMMNDGAVQEATIQSLKLKIKN